MSAPDVPAPQMSVKTAPATAPIFVKVTEPKAFQSSGWATTAVVLLGALVAVIVISRILSLSQRVFELESRPAVEDAQLKGLIKTHIDDTVREMEAAAKQQHLARVQRMQEMQAQQQAAEAQERAAEQAAEQAAETEALEEEEEELNEGPTEAGEVEEKAAEAVAETVAEAEAAALAEAIAEPLSVPVSASKARGSKRKATLSV